MRATILKLLHKNQVAVVERPITFQDIRDAKTAFITSTSRNAVFATSIQLFDNEIKYNDTTWCDKLNGWIDDFLIAEAEEI